MRFQIPLVYQIRLIGFSHIMAEKSHRYDKRDQALFIVIDYFEQFQLFIPLINLF